jgi:hypothetical protein
MEGQELFNSMMENAIVYLQEKGYIPTRPQQSQTQEPEVDWDNPEHTKQVTQMLQQRGLLPKSK